MCWTTSHAAALTHEQESHNVQSSFSEYLATMLTVPRLIIPVVIAYLYVQLTLGRPYADL